MNQHVGNLIPDRIVLPRGLVGRPAAQPAPYQFEVGSLVAWGNQFWLIVGRQRGMRGTEHYDVFRPLDEREYRTVSGSRLGPMPPELSDSDRLGCLKTWLLCHYERQADEDAGETPPIVAAL